MTEEVKTEKIFKRNKFPKGSKHYNWKGGRILDHGYWFILMPDHPFANSKGYVREHRLVVEKRKGRYLMPWEQVHHINGNKLDNRSENLMLFVSNSKHKSYELKGNKFAKIDTTNRFCLLCGGKTYIDRKGYENWFRYKDGFVCDKCFYKKVKKFHK